jgi:hypothetical protein
MNAGPTVAATRRSCLGLSQGRADLQQIALGIDVAKLAQSIGRVHGRAETAGNLGGLPSGMEGVGIADIGVAATCRDFRIMLRRKAQMQLDLAPARKPIFWVISVMFVFDA